MGTFVRMPGCIRRPGGVTREDHADATAHAHVTTARAAAPAGPQRAANGAGGPAARRRPGPARRTARSRRGSRQRRRRPATARRRRPCWSTRSPASRRPRRRRGRPTGRPARRGRARRPGRSGAVRRPRRRRGRRVAAGLAAGRPAPGRRSAPTGGRRAPGRAGPWPPRWQRHAERPPCRPAGASSSTRSGADVSPVRRRGRRRGRCRGPAPPPRRPSPAWPGCRPWGPWPSPRSRSLRGLPRLPKLGPAPGEDGRPSARPAPRPDAGVLHKVTSLLAKAESTTFPDEAEALTAKAQELMTRYAIDRAQLEAGRGDEPVAGGRRLAVDDPYANARYLLLSAVADANRCRAVWTKQWGFSTVFGDEGDLDAVELLLHVAAGAGDAGHGARARVRHGQRRRAPARSATRSWWRSRGASASGWPRRAEAATADAARHSTAMVPLFEARRAGRRPRPRRGVPRDPHDAGVGAQRRGLAGRRPGRRPRPARRANARCRARPPGLAR